MTGNLATVTGYSYVNESVSATTTLTSWAICRPRSPLYRSGRAEMDLGFVVAGSNGYTAYIYSDPHGGAFEAIVQSDIQQVGGSQFAADV